MMPGWSESVGATARDDPPGDNIFGLRVVFHFSSVPRKVFPSSRCHAFLHAGSEFLCG